MIKNNEGFLYPKIDQSLCIECGKCKKVCSLNNDNGNDLKNPECYAVINNSKQDLMKESSGGIFSVIAKKVLNENGVIYGASFSDDFKSVKHIRVSNKVQLEKLYTSKYLQSEIGIAFENIKKDLIDGKVVLFSGTPCQIGGLKLYLNKNYNNLICVDFICHGVPSPKVWDLYLNYLNKENKVIENVNFRNKSDGWTKYNFRIQFENNDEFLQPFLDNPYMNLFLSNYTLRPSCYDCNFKTVSRMSDVTIADFWGIKKSFLNFLMIVVCLLYFYKVKKEEHYLIK